MRPTAESLTQNTMGYRNGCTGYGSLLSVKTAQTERPTCGHGQKTFYHVRIPPSFEGGFCQKTKGLSLSLPKTCRLLSALNALASFTESGGAKTFVTGIDS